MIVKLFIGACVVVGMTAIAYQHGHAEGKQLTQRTCPPFQGERLVYSTQHIDGQVTCTYDQNGTYGNATTRRKAT